jgi:hypothetical protein
MPTNITDVDTFTATLQVPNDGEAVNQDSLLSTFAQGLANRTAYMRKGIPGIATSYRLDIPLAAIRNLSSRFESNNGDIGLIQSSVADPGGLTFPIYLPIHGQMTAVHAIVCGASASGSHASLPATLPSLALYRQTRNAGGARAAAIYMTGVSDPSANAAAYNLNHLISITSLAEVLNPDMGYSVSITGETGAGSEANKFVVRGLYVIITP